MIAIIAAIGSAFLLMHYGLNYFDPVSIAMFISGVGYLIGYTKGAIKWGVMEQ